MIPLYVSDIARPDMRGALSSGMALMLTAGILAVNALSIDNFLGWRAITVASCVAPGIQKRLDNILY